MFIQSINTTGASFSPKISLKIYNAHTEFRKQNSMHLWSYSSADNLNSQIDFFFGIIKAEDDQSSMSSTQKRWYLFISYLFYYYPTKHLIIIAHPHLMLISSFFTNKTSASYGDTLGRVNSRSIRVQIESFNTCDLGGDIQYGDFEIGAIPNKRLMGSQFLALLTTAQSPLEIHPQGHE